MSYSAFAKLGHIISKRKFSPYNFENDICSWAVRYKSILYEIFVCLFVSSLLGGWKSNFDFSSPRVFETLCSSLVFTHFSKYLDADSPRRKWNDVSSLGLFILFMVFDYLRWLLFFLIYLDFTLINGIPLYFPTYIVSFCLWVSFFLSAFLNISLRYHWFSFNNHIYIPQRVF